MPSVFSCLLTELMRLGFEQHWMVCLRNKEDDKKPLDTAPNEERPERPPPESISSARGLFNSLYHLPACILIDEST